MLYFDNAPIHSTEEVQGHLRYLSFTRMEHPLYSPDLAPCDFFLFGTMKENFSGQRFESAQELFRAVEAFLRAFPQFLANRFSGMGTTITDML
jgi:histone-lysine N-methyltransferase SETMAR